MLSLFAIGVLAAASALLLSATAGAAPGKGADGNQADRGEAHQVHASPQPASRADFKGRGANVHGPYDSTRDGSPSGNGNGNGNGGGQAVGKPCAGCVGKADNKNPPGQLPGGSDANSGYECDSNHGVGRTNPAHTGCRTGTPPPPPPPPPPGDNGGGPDGPGAPGGPEGPGAPGEPQPRPAPAAEAAPEGLASTGVPALLQLLGVAGAAILAGTTLLVTGRLRRR